ncbi:MAG TPA: NapC/NirT family cytochrome c [Coriobacteriia bacterium]|nr:NapC/NirT family cytochrome c [Coriobacteriia bacterium]
MAKISLAGFKDPARRPRFIIWALVAVLVIAGVMIPVLGVTSTRWFCSEACHKVQDDTIMAYQASAHSNISCMACHMPVGANPVVFLLHKAEALGELYLTVRDDFELPLNGESEVALTMSSGQCTQCHNMENRNVTPSPGIKIDHAVHAEVNAACPVCHNRVAHVENFDLTLTDPKTGEPNKPHVVFTSMTACFRCHGLEKGAAAPGTCAACHTSGFELKPDNHKEPDFFPGHGEMAMEYKTESDEAIAHAAEAAAEAEEHSALGVDKAYASGGGSGKPQATKEEVPEVIAAQRSHGADDGESIGEELPSTESVFYCSTCHRESFCSNCHGMEIPHPAEFKEPKSPTDAAGHPVISKAKDDKCVMCHGKDEKTQLCSSCHHGEKSGGWEYKTKVPWTTEQHPQAVAAGGVKACTESCHTAKFCVSCHTGRNVYPDSHKQARWTKPKAPGAITTYGKEPAKVSAKHALDAQKSMESCAVCHGTGGANAKFCKSCHEFEMPHPAEFKKQHVSSKKNQNDCKNCHQFREVCSNCHHVGSSLTKSWISVHGASTNKNGPAGCVEKCHTKKDCVSCHTDRDVVPSSHDGGTFVRNFSSKDATHVQLYKKDGEICTYCHAGEAEALPNSKFCKSCHKLEMPHKIDEGNNQKYAHQEGFEKKSLSKSTCANCHKTSFCDSCHHEGSVTSRPWVRYHPNIVKKDGAEPCFECHDEIYCSNCHVNLAKRGLQ